MLSGLDQKVRGQVLGLVDPRAQMTHHRRRAATFPTLGTAVQRGKGPRKYNSAVDTRLSLEPSTLLRRSGKTRTSLAGEVTSHRQCGVVFPWPLTAVQADLDPPGCGHVEDLVRPVLMAQALQQPLRHVLAGLPVGLQLLAGPFEEEKLLRAARTYERVTDWHVRRAASGG